MKIYFFVLLLKAQGDQGEKKNCDNKINKIFFD